MKLFIATIDVEATPKEICEICFDGTVPGESEMLKKYAVAVAPLEMKANPFQRGSEDPMTPNPAAGSVKSRYAETVVFALKNRHVKEVHIANMPRDEKVIAPIHREAANTETPEVTESFRPLRKLLPVME